MSQGITKVAVNIFVLRDNKLLLGKRKNSSGEGFWGLPGGHVEYMESLHDAALRELDEETGLKPGKLDLLHIVNDPLPDDKTHYVYVNFILKDFKDEPRLMEPHKCYGWEWHELKALPSDEELFIGSRKMIKAFLKGGIFWD